MESKTEDRMFWAAFWVLVFGLLLMKNLAGFLFVLFLIVGLTIGFKAFKMRENKKGD